ncbi:flagellar basal body rod protein FlgB [Buchnera aphidicola]|uniref:flagellar basal body rod protein FlgB n=1 Tax=Buchnera aphidicola TaxID=9 RepID=UPI003BEEFCBC
MLDKINALFKFSQYALDIYAKRQEIIASNIANADTPGYQSKDINFKNEINKRLRKNNITNNIQLKKTSPQHISMYKQNTSSFTILPVVSNYLKKNGNTVDMNRERISFIDNSLKYQAHIIFINNQIKNIMHVLRG